MSVGKRKDGRWYTDVTIRVDGKEVRSRDACGPEVRNRAQAMALEHERRAAMLAGKLPRASTTAPSNAPADAAQSPAALITFKAHAEEVMKLHAAVENKHSERKSKRSILDLHLLPAFGESTLGAIGPREIAAYKAQKLSTGLSAKTVNNHLTVLRKCLVLAREWDRLVVVPSVGFLRVKKPEIDFFTFDEAPRVLANADGGAWYAMILCGLRAGLRQGELLELRWEDLDLLKGVIRVRRAIYDGVIDTPKGGRSRDVPMSDELREAFRTLPSRFAGGLVWPATAGRNLTKGEAKWPLWRACRRAGLRRVGWHVLRHTFASHLVMRGVPLKAVQELLGHASIEMTMRYAHLAPDVSRDAVKLLDAPTLYTKASGAE
jgi:integrase